MNRRKITKIAFVFSVCLLVLWGLLGIQSTIAWYKDETPVAKNTFDIQELDLVVYHKVGDDWEEVDKDTEIFNDEALYEPGYTQVVYLKIENKGDVDFDYKLSADMISFVVGQNEKGGPIYLPNHLKFGAVIEKDEITLNREMARILAPNDMDKGEQPTTEKLPLNTYSSEKGELDANAGEDSIDYAAIVIYMPESVGNEANYRGDKIPEIQLGITVKASQRGTLSE